MWCCFLICFVFTIVLNCCVNIGTQDSYRETYLCELCQKHGNGEKSNLLMKNNQLRLDLSPELLHATETESEMHSSDMPRCELSARYVSDHRPKLRILCLHGFRQNASSFKGRTSSLAKKLKNIVDFIFIDAPHELPFIYQPTESCSKQNSLPPLVKCRRRSAWLISPYSALLDESSWRVAEEQFDPLQYQMQTGGFEESFRYLQDVISSMGSFDGILGFSQGAAMAALFCEQQQRNNSVSDFRFAILCSGFSAMAGKSVKKFIKCPSLHVYGGGRGRDRQIHHEASRELAELFDENSSVTIEHDMGHIIPTRSPYIDLMKSFLMGFL